jgi:hypothetical protein
MTALGCFFIVRFGLPHLCRSCEKIIELARRRRDAEIRNK